ncbi:hypothetical protein KUTeg_010421 [Tegillarca granosa]|uniref:Uncharacterized protein n=1 Tax=Tegillarca granosa TaxID=220873 RepID=A0ABQ9FBL1_TEGGR|nr:hypothetical protein KUTeg_010421 [Tegillarca granosa]
MSQKSQTSPTEEKEESKEKHTDEASEKETRAKSTLEVPKPDDEDKETDKNEDEEKKDDEKQKDDKYEKVTGIADSVKDDEEPEELQVLEEVPVIIYRPEVEYKPPPKPKNLGLPFKVKWLNDCYQQTSKKKIARELVFKIEKHFQKPKRREAILQTLGQLFVQKYLPDVTLLPQVLIILCDLKYAFLIIKYTKVTNITKKK